MEALLVPAVRCVRSLLKALWDPLQIQSLADQMAEEMMELREARDEVEVMVLFVEAQSRAERKEEVKVWLQEVDALDGQVARLLWPLEHSWTCVGAAVCAGPSSGFCFLTSGSAARKLSRIRRLMAERGRLGDWFGLLRTAALGDEHLTGVCPIGGFGQRVSKILGHLRDDAVGIVWICGMGGVGKTTLLAAVHRVVSVPPRGWFDVVAWASVSRDPSVLTIQRRIGDQLGLSFSDDGEGPLAPYVEESQAKTLVKFLSGKRFLLVLDDLWDRLDFTEIGIPHPTPLNKCKILLATRLQSVCDDMVGVVQVKVDPLGKDESWDLFCRSVGANVDLNNSSVRQLAATVARKCGGLPLALITVARAMSDATTAGEWREAAEVLSEASNELACGEDTMLNCLKLAYDRLTDDTMRYCFLYCSLFSEDYEIDKEQLIECWVAEGFLDSVGSGSITRARNRGRAVINKLKATGLLENGSSDPDRYVKMHDLIHQMASRITEAHQFAVDAGKGSTEILAVERWKDATQISVANIKKGMLALADVPLCHSLRSLLITDNSKIEELPGTFFNLTPFLRVLDLSRTSIRELPREIGLLHELRYLNLSATYIRSLPVEVGNLVNLRHLNLSSTRGLSLLPTKAISKLTGLQALDLYHSAYAWCSEPSEHKSASLRDLECLISLVDIGLDLKTLPILKIFLQSCKLSRSTRRLALDHLECSNVNLHLLQSFETSSKLQELSINRCSGLEKLTFNGHQLLELEALLLSGLPLTQIVIDIPSQRHQPIPIFGSLRHLYILGCHALRDLSWVQELPRLNCVDLRVCNGLEEVIASETENTNQSSSILPKLRAMHLHALPKLQRISRFPLLLPSLKSLEVYACPRLEKLPLGLNSAQDIKHIFGRQQWWDRLQWDQESIRLAFTSHFRDPWQQHEEHEEDYMKKWEETIYSKTQEKVNNSMEVE